MVAPCIYCIVHGRGLPSRGGTGEGDVPQPSFRDSAEGIANINKTTVRGGMCLRVRAHGSCRVRVCVCCPYGLGDDEGERASQNDSLGARKRAIRCEGWGAAVE